MPRGYDEGDAIGQAMPGDVASTAEQGGNPKGRSVTQVTWRWPGSRLTKSPGPSPEWAAYIAWTDPR